MASESRKLRRSTVEVAGYRGRTLQNHLVRQDGPAAWLAIVAGDADPHFDREILAELEGRGDVTSVIEPGADHSMEVPDGPMASLGILTRVTAALGRFVR